MGIADGPHPFPHSTQPFSLRYIPQILCMNRGAMLAICGYVGHMWELYAVWSSLPVFLRSYLTSHGYASQDATTHAALLSFFTIAFGGLSCIGVGWVAERLGRTVVCCVCSAASGVCSLIVGYMADAAPLPITVALVIFWGLVAVPDSPQYTTLVVELIDPTLVGTALVLQQCVGYLATIPTIFLIPLLADAPGVGWKHAFIVLAIGAIGALAAMVRLHTLRRRGEASPLTAQREVSIIEPNCEMSRDRLVTVESTKVAAGDGNHT